MDFLWIILILAIPAAALYGMHYMSKHPDRTEELVNRAVTKGKEMERRAKEAMAAKVGR